MSWIKISYRDEVRWGELRDHSNLGSSEASTLRFDHPNVLPVVGVFRKVEGGWRYRSLINQSEVSIETNGWVKFQDWKFELLEFPAAWAQFGTSLIKDYRHSTSELSIFRKYLLNTETPPLVLDQISQVRDELDFLGPIERLLNDEDVTDILVESFDRIYIEKSGRLTLSGFRFSDSQTYELYLEKILHRAKKKLDSANPYVDFSYANGERAHLIAPPITDGMFYLSIRKPSKKVWSLQDLRQMQMLDDQALEQIEGLCSKRMNFLISGATGSGKSSLLRGILLQIPTSERIIIIEDVPELRVGRRNAAYLNTRIDSTSLLPEVSLRDLVRQALRMRAERLVIGEVRGAEAFDLLSAMNTGHRGSIGTLHANDCRDALWRLQTLARFSSADLSEESIRELMVRNIQAIVHCDRKASGERFVSEIALVKGLESGCFLLEYVFNAKDEVLQTIRSFGSHRF